MTIRVLISFFCDDRPGVIEEISRLIETHRGNWLDSQLARLGGRFAGVLLVQVPVARQEALAAALAGLESRGIRATLTSGGEAPSSSPAPASRRITLLGPDRPGIVHELTRAMHAAGFNVLAMTTSVESAPMSGEPLFRAEARIEIGEGSRLDELEWQLDAMAEAMTLDIDILDA